MRQADPLDDPRITSWGLMVETYSTVMATLQRDLEQRCGLAPTWFEVLLRLSRTPGGRLRMTELAEQVSFSSGGFTRLADRIEAAGLIERQLCPTDRRAAFAAITESGRSVVEQAAVIHLEGLQQHVFDHLDDAQRQALDESMRLITAGGGTRSRGPVANR